MYYQIQTIDGAREDTCLFLKKKLIVIEIIEPHAFLRAFTGCNMALHYN